MGGDEWERLWPMENLLDGGTWGRLCVRGVGVFLAVRLLCLLRRIFDGGAGLEGWDRSAGPFRKKNRMKGTTERASIDRAQILTL